MPAFICDNCGCIDNTACGGSYWTQNMDIWPDEFKGKVLCCVCVSPFYKTGERNPDAGIWHNYFERRFPTEESIKRDGIENFKYLGKFEYLRKNHEKE